MIKELSRQSVRRPSGEPTAAIGETISVKEGVIGVVLGRYAAFRHRTVK